MGHLTWQGIPQPNSRKAGITATLGLCVGGVPQSYSVATDASGFFTVTTGLPDGTYNWNIKGQRSLANSGSLVITGGGATFEVGMLRAGDCNNNNVVNSTDFSLLRTSFGRALGDPGYNDRADFNRDNLVSSADFNMLRGNFGQGGATLICP